MEYTRTVLKIGDSLAITIDKEIVKAYNIKENDQVIHDLKKVLKKPIESD